MSEHNSVVIWDRDGAAFVDNRYSRAHRWLFDGGVEVPASSSPLAVPLPMSVHAAVDPEEAFVASLSSCHMLWFLAIAAKKGFLVENYRDEASGVLERDSTGHKSITTVTLRPDVRFGGPNGPTEDDIAAMHDQAHEQCYLARSVKAEIRCIPVAASAPSIANPS